jgi:heptosyltransferase III
MEHENLEIKKILISRTDNLGDVILTLPVITAFKKLFPDSEISFLIQKKNSQILKNYPGIARIIYYDDFKNFSDRLNYFRKNKFDAAISVFPVFDIALLFFLAGIKIRIGTGYRWYSFLFNRKVYEHRKYAVKHESDYNLDLLKPITGDIKLEKKYFFRYSEDEEIKYFNKVKSYNLFPDEKYIIIHPGSGNSARDWSIDKFKSLSELFLKEYPGYKIVITGLDEESYLSKSVIDSVQGNPKSRVVDLTGKITLPELVILIDKSVLFISNSTGPIHIAGALNKKIIGFYPDEIPMNETRWRPLSDNAVILKPDKAGGSMDTISVEDTFNSIRNLID